jgi:hypothetical protein
MQVTVRLVFITHCLGGETYKSIMRFSRDPDGCILFNRVWWHRCLEYGNQRSKEPMDLELIKQILPSPTINIIEGDTVRYRKSYTRSGERREQSYEALPPGAVVEVGFLLPDEISTNQFIALLSICGEYVGISPSGWRGDFGKFKISGYQRD